MLFPFLEPPAPGLPHAADPDPKRGEPRIGVRRAQPQPIFRACSEHAVGFGHSLEREVVDHHRQIAVGPVERRGRKALLRTGGVQAGHEALRRSLFIARRAIDLARAIQPRQGAELEIAAERAWVDVVVFDGITRRCHLDSLQALDAPQHRKLCVDRQ